jgi:hypothetical protein
MLHANYQVAGFSETLAKVRKAVHKIFPRELSPSRMAEKFGSDAKKKAAKKIATAQIESETHAAANDALLKRQLDVLQAAMPVSGVVLPFDTMPHDTSFAPTATVPVAAPSILVKAAPWLLGAGALVILLRSRK